MSDVRSFEIKLKYGQPGKYTKLSVAHLDPKFLRTTEDNALLLKPILDHIEQKLITPSSYMVSSYSEKRGIYIFLGLAPVADRLAIPLDDIAPRNLLKLKLRFGLQTETTGRAQSYLLDDDDDASDRGKTGKRTKERKIGYIIEKVARWRSLYNGVQNAKGETIRLTLEEAALQVGISKKSLDDYLLQLRFGRKYGFNFEEHKHDKVGILRNYVKKYKQINSDLLKLKPGERASSETLRLLKEPGCPPCKVLNCCVSPPGALKNFSYIEQLIKSEPPA